MAVKTPGYAPRVTWDTLPGKPTTFPPAAHTHAWGDITGKPTTFAPSAHTHAGLLTLVGTVTVGETVVLSLALGVKRYTGTMAGLAVGDRIIALLTGPPGSSSLQDVYVSATNTYNVGVLNPALGLGAVIAVPIAIYKVS